MVCPFLCVVITPSGLVGGVGVPFFSVNRLLLSPGVKKGLPEFGKSLYDVAILFYGADLSLIHISLSVSWIAKSTHIPLETN